MVSTTSPREGNAIQRQRSDADFSHLLFRACHDVRSPSRTIQTQAQLIGRDPANSHLAEGLGLIIDSAKRLDSLVDRLVSYSVALETAPDAFQPVRLDVCLRTALAKLDREIAGHNATVNSADLPRVSGDPDRLTQVFEELIGNSVRHGGTNSVRVDITADRKEAEWLIALRDSGSGIPDASLERIFKPFEKLNAEHRGGAGMGLAISRIIVERHGGRMWAESAPGSGAAIFFTLPVMR